MKRNRKAKILAVMALLGALGAGLGRKGARLGSVSLPDVTPEDAIYAVMNAAKAGNVSGYLDGYTGPMKAALQRSVEEGGAREFAKYLQRSNAGVKGAAVSIGRSP